MILGLSMPVFTLAHVLISVAGLLSGLVVLAAMIASRPATGWTALFLATTVATSATGFLFPFRAFGPSYVIGAISLVVLAAALLALYGGRLAGHWRPTYVVAAVLALYLNAFVAVAQAFQKLPGLAPTQSGPSFLEAELAMLALFVVLGALALWRFRPQPALG